MVDYSKFDKIVDSDDEQEQEEERSVPTTRQPTHPIPTNTQPMDDDLQAAVARAGFKPPATVKMTEQGKEGRLRFEHEGRTIYEWEQSLEEVNIYITPPPGVKANMIDCKISHQHLTLGLKGNPPFLNEDLGGPVKAEESYWMMDEDGEININLQKMVKAETWQTALMGNKGQQMDPFTAESVKKKMMLERFQEENPGFDFSGAEFNGAVPDPQSFMGGVRYT